MRSLAVRSRRPLLSTCGNERREMLACLPVIVLRCVDSTPLTRPKRLLAKRVRADPIQSIRLHSTRLDATRLDSIRLDSMRVKGAPHGPTDGLLHACVRACVRALPATPSPACLPARPPSRDHQVQPHLPCRRLASPCTPAGTQIRSHSSGVLTRTETQIVEPTSDVNRGNGP